MNDSGKIVYYENGKAVTGKKAIGDTTYEFNQYGEIADVPKNLNYTTYTVQKGDSFWSIRAEVQVQYVGAGKNKRQEHFRYHLLRRSSEGAGKLK